jgi:AmmeMemoRadiSam system protein B
MNRYLTKGLLLAALLCGALSGGCRATGPAEPPALALPPKAAEQSARPLSAHKEYLECLHYEEKGFLKALEKAAPYALEGRMLAAISPHFLPAMSYTANILATLAQNSGGSPTIYVQTPNHSGQGLPLLVADRGWSTPFGPLEADEEATAALLNYPQLAGKLDIDIYHLQSDHSAATLMPFVKYYLPNASIVTVLLTKGCPLTDLQVLAAHIYASAQDKEVFLLASVDFSHYLRLEETAARDEITRQLIEAWDIPAIKTLDSGNLDSPEALATLLSYAAYFPGARAQLMESVILPESPQMPHIGYSYKAYIFSAPE